ncbi:MAG TPA: DUF1800 domain-containing protein [Acidobacteriota bacterium]|nr:DUF1800 domain-containing protein [Acidobacteriota bacterium]
MRRPYPSILLILLALLLVLPVASGAETALSRKPASTPLDSYKPSAQEPWDYERAAHLLRRAGFGGDYKQVQELVQLGSDKALDRLLEFDADALTRFDARVAAMNFDLGERDDIKGWWICRMYYSPAPLQEKMALFWHNHFATSMRKVRAPELMVGQNELFRQYALSDFQRLLLEVSKDPAMIQWLDNSNNLKGKPNENYARELMELFTIGIGHYTEQDIKEAARAFTGWQMDFKGFCFSPEQHDFGQKTFMGQTGEFNGGDIIKIIMLQPATSEYIARKLFQFFAYDDPDDAVIKQLASIFAANHYQIRPVVEKILRSRAFFSEKSMQAQIKSPVEYVLGTAKTLNLEVNPQGAKMLARAAAQMGQNLFEPPSVKGWDGGRAWINTSTLLNRQNFVQQLTRNRAQQILELRKKLSIDNTPEPDKALDAYARALLQRPLSEKDRAALMPYAEKISHDTNPGSWRELTYQILSLPGYQLN